MKRIISCALLMFLILMNVSFALENTQPSENMALESTQPSENMALESTQPSENMALENTQPSENMSDVDFYLQLVDEYKSENPDASENQVNDMLRKAVKKYNPIFKEFQSKSVSIMYSEYSDYLPTQVVDLNDEETVVFNSNPVYGLNVLVSAKNAITQTNSRYRTGLHNGNADAFRHAYWNVHGSFSSSTSYMKQFADAHEEGSSNPMLEHEMDYWNNDKGRTYYTRNSTAIATTLYSQGHTGLGNMVQNDLVRAGKLKRYSGANFDGYSLVASDNLGEK